jgi:hypothetical protein
MLFPADAPDNPKELGIVSFDRTDGGFNSRQEAAGSDQSLHRLQIAV